MRLRQLVAESSHNEKEANDKSPFGFITMMHIHIYYVWSYYNAEYEWNCFMIAIISVLPFSTLTLSDVIYWIELRVIFLIDLINKPHYHKRDENTLQ